jgi:hypothetical protein
MPEGVATRRRNSKHRASNSHLMMRKKYSICAVCHAYHRSVDTDCDILKDLLSQKGCKEGVKSKHQNEENCNCNNLLNKIRD